MPRDSFLAVTVSDELAESLWGRKKDCIEITLDSTNINTLEDLCGNKEDAEKLGNEWAEYYRKEEDQRALEMIEEYHKKHFDAFDSTGNDEETDCGDGE